jgi:hypothetical protein
MLRVKVLRKRILSIVLTVFMTFTALPAGVFAEESASDPTNFVATAKSAIEAVTWTIHPNELGDGSINYAMQEFVLQKINEIKTDYTTTLNITVSITGFTNAGDYDSARFIVTITPKAETTVGESADTYSGTLTVTESAPDPALSSDATLSDLKINGTSIAGFVSTTTEYTVEVPYETEVITIAATANNGGASILGDTGAGSVNFAGSEMLYTVTVTAEDGTTIETYTITVTRADKAPDPAVPSQGDNDSYGNSGRSGIASPMRNEYISPNEPGNDKNPDDNTNTDRGINNEVNGVQSDEKEAKPLDTGDKAAEVTVDGKTFETHSLTAAEAIADGEVTEVFVTPSGGVAAVTKSGNVIAGANSTGSLNSASTTAALKAAADEILITFNENGKTETPLITVIAGQEVTAISDNTLEKIITVQNDCGINTQIQKIQYSVDENDRIDELIYRITIPVEEDNIRDIRLDAEFSTAVVEASITAFENTFGNTDCAGFALKQKDTFGAEATIEVKISAIGFYAEPGDTVYAAIFNPETGKFTQEEGIVGERVLSLSRLINPVWLLYRRHPLCHSSKAANLFIRRARKISLYPIILLP